MIYDYEFWSDLAPWEKYYSDIIIEIDHVLTEPTCPYAIVRFELKRCPIGRIASSSGETIEDAVNTAINLAVKQLTEWKDKTVNEIVQERIDEKELHYQEIRKIINLTEVE